MSQIHPNAVVHKDAEIGEDVYIGPNCIVERGAVLGDGNRLEANVYIGADVKVGKDNHFHMNSVVGGLPQIFGLTRDAKYGTIEIGDGNMVRENVTIHPSMHEGELTKIGSRNLFMIGVHLGHDVTVEDDIVMSNYAQISGHCKIERGVWMSGMVCLHQFVTMGKWSYAAALAGVNHDVPPFMTISGHYPPLVRNINKRGMIRAGLSDADQKAVLDAFKRLYRNGEPLLENAKSLADEADNEQVQTVVDAILKSSEHRFGRYLEQFRH